MLAASLLVASVHQRGGFDASHGEPVRKEHTRQAQRHRAAATNQMAFAWTCCAVVVGLVFGQLGSGTHDPLIGNQQLQ
jgi:hypothetical protein